MRNKKLLSLFEKAHKKYPYITNDNFCRILLLTHGIDYYKKDSYPDPFTRYELVFKSPEISVIPLLTLLNPTSPFKIINGNSTSKVLLYDSTFVDTVSDFEITHYDLNKNEPFYFYVREVNGDLVLKLNPIQLCDFFRNTDGLKPCVFCFRNDMVNRFKNITAYELIKKTINEEKKRDNLETLRAIDELSIITGSYKNDEQYIAEIAILVSYFKKHISEELRVVVGSHEGKGKKTYEKLKTSGVTTFAFPIESFDNKVRQRGMQNRKGTVQIETILDDIQEAVDVFGHTGVIIRVVAGIGDNINARFKEIIKQIAHLNPLWNINIYMPFTHYHWQLFKQNRPFDSEYLLSYCNTINQFVPVDKQMRFKISP